jgi:hypothetical protein
MADKPDYTADDFIKGLVKKFGPEDTLDAFRRYTAHYGDRCPTCYGDGFIDTARLAEMMERPGISPIAAHKTSRVAGTTPNKGTGRYNVLMDLRNRGPQTAFTIANVLDKAPNQIATRLGELHDDTFVQYLRNSASRTIVEWDTTPGNTGMVHVITDAGLMALNEAHR